MKRVLFLIWTLIVSVGSIWLYKDVSLNQTKNKDGVSIRVVSASDTDKTRLIMAIKNYIPVEMLDMIFEDGLLVEYKDSPMMKDANGLYAFGLCSGNRIKLVHDVDMIVVLHEFSHLYDIKMKFSTSDEFLDLYEKYKDLVEFRLRTSDLEREYVTSSNYEFFAECYAYYLAGDLSCSELEVYFDGIGG